VKRVFWRVKAQKSYTLCDCRLTLLHVLPSRTVQQPAQALHSKCSAGSGLLLVVVWA